MRVVIAAIGLVAAVSAAATPIGVPQGPVAPSTARDLFWCPMHPDVRSSASGKCPICSMDLVRIPPPTLGNYRLQVRQVPRKTGSGVGALRIEVRDPSSLQRVGTFSPLHERLLHLFIVGRDLAYFSHVHPTLADGGFEASVDLDPGAYVLIADFAPSGGAPQLVQRAIVTPGYKGSLFAPPHIRADHSPKSVDGVNVGLDAATRVLKPSVLTFSVRDVATGVPVNDLEPFLGAPGHLLIVNPDLTLAMHVHPETREDAQGVGAQVVFAPTFGSAGVYKMWVQFQRAGRIITAPFAVAVE